jgi:rsbT antagonist protein RsbS
MNSFVRIPIIKLYDNLIVSIQVALSDRLAQQLKDDITDQIQSTKAKGLIIDVSGVDLIDSYLSRALRDIGLISRMMGVRTVICGLDPLIAMTLVEMDMSLQGVRTALSLERAVELLDEDRKHRSLSLFRKPGER